MQSRTNFQGPFATMMNSSRIAIIYRRMGKMTGKKYSEGSYDRPPLPDPGPPFDEDEFMRGVYKEAGEIWNTLSQEDVSAYTKDRNGLSYLSWASAWAVMMKHYPGFEVEFDEVSYLPDKSAMVKCRVQVLSICRDMWLPVMDYRHKAIANPSARDVSDSKQRCMTKCFALFGLGHYIFDGEDLPPNLDKPEKKDKTEKKESSSKKKSTRKKTNGVIPEEDAGVHVAIKEFIKDCKDMTSLMEYYRKNEGELNKLKENHPDIHVQCMSEFTKRREELQDA